MTMICRTVMSLVACSVLLTSPVCYADGTKTDSNKKYNFSVSYPALWQAQPLTSPDTKFHVASLSPTPYAGCAVVIKEMPQLSEISQRDLDLAFLNSPPNSDQYKAALMQGFNDVSVVAVSQGKLGGRIAHLIRARYSVSSASSKEFVSVRVAKAFSPGLSWTLSCAGEGKSPEEAERAFEFWQSSINAVFSTFRSP